jgi:hypothetical protein
MIRNLKKHNNKIVALIERYCKKKLVFAARFLPFGTVGEAYTQIAHLVFPNPHAEMKNQKSYFFANARTELAAEVYF